MNKIYLFVFMIITSLTNAQTNQEQYRNLVKKTLNGYYANNKNFALNSYTKEDDLKVDFELELSVTMSEFLEFGSMDLLHERSTKTAYSVFKEISESVLIEQIKSECNYRFIDVHFRYMTKDRHKIDIECSLPVSKLYEISKEFNMRDFENIFSIWIKN